MRSRVFLAVCLQVLSALAAPKLANDPSVNLGNGVFTGKTSGSVQKFLGIPFAQPPVGNLRYRLPQPITGYNGTYSAANYGPSCIQQAIEIPLTQGIIKDISKQIVDQVLGAVFPDSEDCLTINVVRPATATVNSKLPVVAWIFGGGFELGATSMYDGEGIVSRSLDLKSPVIFVSMNYRLSGLGFLPGREVKAAGVGNLGLQDQREAFRWIQKYIGQFGGDPSKVTIWGESAGAISVAMHMVANNGNTEGLFRAGFMQSGAPIPVGDITNGQKYYDALVKDSGCSGTSDTLQCLRTVPYAQLRAAINKSPSIFAYQSLSLAWLPRADGVFITDDPLKLVQQGKVAKIPYVTGNCDDEGTLFSISTLNITTDSQLKNWVKTSFLPGSTDVAINTVANLYPQDITAGSPFDTGILNAISPQFKRIAAFLGDGVFQAPRRWMLENTVASNPNVWAFVSKRFKSIPILGSLHAHDLLNVFGGGELADYLIRFAVNLDPNGGLLTYDWPKYTLRDRKLLTFEDGIIFKLSISKDDYRQAGMKAMIDFTLQHPL